MKDINNLDMLLASFRDDRNETFKLLYSSYRDEFLSFSRSYNNDVDQCLDCFQDSLLALYENLVRAKITENKSSTKTYLFAIGKNKLIDTLNKNKRTAEEELHEHQAITIHNEDDSFSTEKSILKTALGKLKNKCREILTRYYYDRQSIEAIMQDMGYKNHNTVKAHKSRCLSGLKELVRELK